MAQGKRIRVWKFVVFAVIMTCGALVAGICVAKMINNRESNEEELQIAKWSVSADGAEDEIELTAGGEEKTYSLTVTNDSEVASSYKILLSGLPDGVMVGIDEGELQSTEDGGIVFTSDDFVLDMYEHKTQEHTLRFSAVLTEDTVSIPDEDIAIDVIFTQEDSRI